MMDQNRCLLDVIDNPQLLQSFLETEANADSHNERASTTGATTSIFNTDPVISSTLSKDSTVSSLSLSSAHLTDEKLESSLRPSNLDQIVPSDSIINSCLSESPNLSSEGPPVEIKHEASTVTAESTRLEQESAILAQTTRIGSPTPTTETPCEDLRKTIQDEKPSYSCESSETETRASSEPVGLEARPDDVETLGDAPPAFMDPTSAMPQQAEPETDRFTQITQSPGVHDDKKEETESESTVSETGTIPNQDPADVNMPQVEEVTKEMAPLEPSRKDPDNSQNASLFRENSSSNSSSDHPLSIVTSVPAVPDSMLTPSIVTPEDSGVSAHMEPTLSMPSPTTTLPDFALPISQPSDSNLSTRDLTSQSETTTSTETIAQPTSSLDEVPPLSSTSTTVPNPALSSRNMMGISCIVNHASSAIISVTSPATTTSSATLTPSTNLTITNSMATSIASSNSLGGPVVLSNAPSTPATTTVVTTISAQTLPTPKTAPKRAPAKRSAPRTSKAKNAKAANNQTTTTGQSPLTTQQQPHQMQNNQFGNPITQQPMLLQTNNLRPPTMLGPPTMSGVPQQQRVIQIQTANGPMYFAIAPGPAVTGGPMVTQQPHGPSSSQPQAQQQIHPPSQPMHQQQTQQQTQPVQQQQRHQQPGMQSQSQYPSQQICLQPNSPSVMMNPRPQGQPMMMPRMPNQIILNRPMNSPGQLLPGQQQFIQIQTPNGPMLLALPTQQAQPTMIDYNSQVQSQHKPAPQQQQQQQQQQQMHQQQSQIMHQQETQNSPQSNTLKSAAGQVKGVANSKSGLDLADLLLDCGILPEDRTGSTQSPSSVKTAQSPSLQQGPMTPVMHGLPPQIGSPMGSMDSASLSTGLPQHPIQTFPNQPMQQQQPVRITIGPDGQMIMQPTIYGAMRPVMSTGIGHPHLANVPQVNNMTTTPTNPPMMSLSSSPSIPTTTESPNSDAKKPPVKGKGAATKRSRSKKQDVDKFPQLKTPKIAQQQQQQQLQQQTQVQTVPLVPMTVIVNDQNKVLAGTAAGSDVKPNAAQLAGGQQVSMAKIVTPVMQSLGNSNMMQSVMGQQTHHLQQQQQQQNKLSANQLHNTQLALDHSPGNSISMPLGIIQPGVYQQQQHHLHMQHQQQIQAGQANGPSMVSSSTSQTSSSGNVTSTVLLPKVTGTVETNPHISSSLMPSSQSLTVDTQKIEQNGLKPSHGQQLMATTTTTKTPAVPIQPQSTAVVAPGVTSGLAQTVRPTAITGATTIHTIKGIQTTTGLTATLVIQQPITPQAQKQLQQQQQLQIQQQNEQLAARQLEKRAQSILNQLTADQNAALNPQIKHSFESIEDACKRLLRYHVFDAEPISEAETQRVDDIFEAAATSLLAKKKAIFDKFKYLILKQSMETVAPCELVMLEQAHVNDEISHLNKEKDLFKEYEAHLDSMSLKQSRTDSNRQEDSEYFSFGERNSPNHGNQDDLSNSIRTGDDDWLMSDKWGKTSYPTVPDSEAATAIESILNDDIG